eukprot:jgi/Botrbrau1/23246/Bobra.0041s0082.1
MFYATAVLNENRAARTMVGVGHAQKSKVCLGDFLRSLGGLETFTRSATINSICAINSLSKWFRVSGVSEPWATGRQVCFVNMPSKPHRPKANI